ncbi:hypothetical protein L798_09285 [Zootermopsis nevadensis]|uniref:Uncharacterized protein n=1 Tax=Zootermopsis nevadensis TaxID=136037 RepID=A0A067R3V2_ZOONE|nr:hypothetical protein L798_09285 [Zootermopsis nevadensis]
MCKHPKNITQLRYFQLQFTEQTTGAEDNNREYQRRKYAAQRRMQIRVSGTKEASSAELITS